MLTHAYVIYLYIVTCWGSKVSDMLRSEELWMTPSMLFKRQIVHSVICSVLFWHNVPFMPPFCVWC